MSAKITSTEHGHNTIKVGLHRQCIFQ